MAQILPMKDRLEFLATLINSDLDIAYDSLLNTCINLAEAKALCVKRGITFQGWVEKNLKIGYTLAVRYSRIGGTPDPRKALEDMRNGKAAAMRAARAIVPRGTTPKVYPPEEFDEEEQEVVDTDDSYRRRRAFLYRAREAVDFALADNMDGLELSREIVDVARKVAQVWADLADRLESRYGQESQQE